MFQTEGTRAYHLRDRHGASRSVAYLMLAGSPFVLATGLFLPETMTLPMAVAIIATSLLLGAGSLMCFRWPHLLPAYFWAASPFVATALITGLNVMTHDASTGAQLFYLWPVLYSANFLSRRLNIANTAFVLAGDALTLFTVLPADRALADLAAVTLAMTLISVVVVPLRERADQLRARLETQALADPLTGLANRRYFDESMVEAGVWAARTDRPVALVSVDVDHFKVINDTWGHAVGDQALQEVAAAMRSVAGPDDVVARLGGDEFVMLLRTGRGGAVSAAEGLVAAIAATTTLPGGPPGLSIGIAVLPDDADTVEDLATASDAALYEAKSRGRGQVAMAAPARMNVDARRALKTVTPSR